jgi:hypothetical protein
MTIMINAADVFISPNLSRVLAWASVRFICSPLFLRSAEEEEEEK